MRRVASFAWLRWLGVVLLTFSLGASSPVTHGYWQQLFERSPEAVAYPASFYGVSEASTSIGQTLWQSGQRAVSLHYLRLGVQQGDAHAARLLADYIPSQRDYWRSQASLLGDETEILRLAADLLATDPDAAVATLLSGEQDVRKLPKMQRQALMRLLFNHPWLQDQELNWQQILANEAALAPDSIWLERQILAQQLASTTGLKWHTGACSAQVELRVEGGQGREQLYAWLLQLREHPMADLGLCWFEAQQPAQCEETSAGRLRCDVDTQRYQVTVAAQQHQFASLPARANVHGRAMSISAASSFSVWVHELGHMFGLADEYPMAQALAAAFCRGDYAFNAQNLYITPRDADALDADQVVAVQRELPWQAWLQQPIAQRQASGAEVLGSANPEQIGLFAVDTCEGTGFQAWRPVAKTTFMQQHEVGVVPDLYIQLMRQHLLGYSDSHLK